MTFDTVDGSEIPRNNHLGCIPKPVQIMGSTTNLNWCRPDFWTINSNSRHPVTPQEAIGSDNLTCRPSRFRRMPQPPKKMWSRWEELYLIPWFMTGFYRKFKSIYIYKCVYLKKCIYIYKYIYTTIHSTFIISIPGAVWIISMFRRFTSTKWNLSNC